MFDDFPGWLCFLAFLVVVLAAGLFLVVYFLGAVQRVLTRVRPESRRMQPGHVYLNLIPVFNMVWATATVVLVAESLRNEYRARGLDSPDEDYGRSLGITLLVLLSTGVLFYPAFLTYPAALVVLVLYWLRLNRHAAELKSGVVARTPGEKVDVDEGW